MLYKNKVTRIAFLLFLFIFIKINAQYSIPYGSFGYGGREVSSTTSSVLGILGQFSNKSIESNSYSIESGLYPIVLTENQNNIVYPTTISVFNNYYFGDVEVTSSYRMIGIPGQNNLPIDQVMIGEEGKEGDWRAFWDSGVGNYIEYDGTSKFNFIAGKAFWVVSKNPISIELSNISNVNLSADNSYSIPLQDEWNIISNPFNINVKWNDVKIINNISLNQPLFYFDGNPDYSNSDLLETFKGYYFNNSSSNLESLKIPYSPITSNPLPKMNTSGQKELELELVLNSNSKQIIKIGVSETAKSRLDNLDIFAPPSNFSQTSIAILNKKFNTDYKYLQSEYRPKIGEGQEFTIVVKNLTNELIELVPKNISNFQEYDIFLLDNNQMKFYDLMIKNKIEIEAGTSEKTFSLFIGTNEYLENKRENLLPDKNLLSQNYPNPFNPKTSIMFSLKEQTIVNLKIYNVLGELVAVLINNELYEQAYHEIEFNASSLVSGLYIYTLNAGDFTQTKKMLLVK